uniref:Probable proton-coupled zinc antiporter SLC30A3 n=2 Tax=Oryzias sinensis TaxID=183150 RepID=A0A8C8E0R8_9TELE
MTRETSVTSYSKDSFLPAVTICTVQGYFDITVCSFPETKEQYADLPLQNGSMSGAMELKQRVSAHCHRSKPPHGEQSGDKVLAKRKLFIASGVCLIFMIGEVIGGYLAHSLAIMTDAAHLLTDFGSMMVSLFSLWISSRPPTKTMNFGWHRSEILGAFVSVMSIWVVTGALVYLAIERIVQNDYEIEGHVMLATSGCAVIVNIIMAYILHHSTTLHPHGSGYHQIDEDGRSPVNHGHAHTLLGGHSNTSVRAAFIHVIGDLLQSVGVMVAAIIIYVRPEYKVADPICTFLFSLFVLCTTVTILRDVFRILMEGSPKGIEFSSVKEVLLSVKAVKSMHCLHLWALTLGQSLVSVHLAIEEEADPQAVLQEATDLLIAKFGFHSITIQVELYSEDMSHCSHCQDPSD